MRHDRKETLSPTLVQSLTQTKSPLTAFGEGLMKVGETNQKIHDTIWEHDLREERRERERIKFEMEQELHKIQVESQQHALNMAKRYEPIEREAGIANTRANTWNTSENALWTKTQKDAFVDNRTENQLFHNAIANGLYNGDITEKGDILIKQLNDIENDPTKSMREREEARNQRIMLLNKIGEDKARQLNSGNPAEIEADNTWLRHWFGIEFDRDAKNKVVTSKGNNYASALVSSLKQISMEYPETFEKIMFGKMSIDDIKDEKERYRIRNAFGTFANRYPLPKALEEKRQSLYSMIPRLEQITSSYQRIKDNNQILKELERKTGIVFGFDTKDMTTIKSNREFLKMIIGSANMKGALSDKDMTIIDEMIGRTWAMNKEFYISVRNYLEALTKDINKQLKQQPEIFKIAHFGRLLENADFVVKTIDNRIINQKIYGDNPKSIKQIPVILGAQ